MVRIDGSGPYVPKNQGRLGKEEGVPLANSSDGESAEIRLDTPESVEVACPDDTVVGQNPRTSGVLGALGTSPRLNFGDAQRGRTVNTFIDGDELFLSSAVVAQTRDPDDPLGTIVLPDSQIQPSDERPADEQLRVGQVTYEVPDEGQRMSQDQLRAVIAARGDEAVANALREMGLGQQPQVPESDAMIFTAPAEEVPAASLRLAGQNFLVPYSPVEGCRSPAEIEAALFGSDNRPIGELLDDLAGDREEAPLNPSEPTDASGEAYMRQQARDLRVPRREGILLDTAEVDPSQEPPVRYLGARTGPGPRRTR